MLEVSGEMNEPMEAARTMNLFCHGVKIEYGFSLVLAAVLLSALFGRESSDCSFSESTGVGSGTAGSSQRLR